MTHPVQAWAHKVGTVSISPLRAADWSLAALAARAQISEAFSRFAVGYDEARVDVVVSCFTSDAAYQVAQGSAELLASVQGRAQLEAVLPNVLAQQRDQRRHIITNVLVDHLDLEAGTAEAVAESVVLAAADGVSIGASVIYSTRLRREDDGCWRFSYFLIGMDTYAGTPPTTS